MKTQLWTVCLKNMGNRGGVCEGENSVLVSVPEYGNNILYDGACGGNGMEEEKVLFIDADRFKDK